MHADVRDHDEDAAWRWTVPVVYLVVALAAVLSTGGHYAGVMAGGGVFAVWVFHATLQLFERVDAAAEREAAAHVASVSSPRPPELGV